MVGAPKDTSAVATPSRRRSSAAMERQGGKPGGPGAKRSAGGAAAGMDGLPPEAKGLSWPQKFCEAPKGDRLELSEEGSLATRTSGVGYGAAFLGPLSLERSGNAYFEVEVAEMEPNRSQTMAIGICCSLPAAPVLRVERARDLGEGTFIVGYDLPKFYAGGQEAAKISTKEWRPLKELKVGDRVGLLVQRKTMELSVFVNGVKKASAAGLGGGQRWPSDVWGVLDLHGTVKSVWLRSAAAAKRKLQRNATVQLPAPPAEALGEPRSSGGPADHFDATQEFGSAPLSHARLGPAAGAGALVAVPTNSQEQDGGGKRRVAAKAGLESGPGQRKRQRVTTFPCGCMVHLLCSNRAEVHVRQNGEFVIGRNETSDLVLDSPLVPKMVSRRHATVVSSTDAVLLQDCGSTNGTYVNGRRVGHETLRHGDQIIVGNPTQSPKELHFRVSLPGGA